MHFFLGSVQGIFDRVCEIAVRVAKDCIRSGIVESFVLIVLYAFFTSFGPKDPLGGAAASEIFMIFAEETSGFPSWVLDGFGIAPYFLFLQDNFKASCQAGSKMLQPNCWLRDWSLFILKHQLAPRSEMLWQTGWDMEAFSRRCRVDIEKRWLNASFWSSRCFWKLRVAVSWLKWITL